MRNAFEKYGPVVRVTPYELAFSSAEAFRDIYGSRPGHKSFRKDRTHYSLPPNGVDHLVTAIDDTVHARHRKLLSYAFSERAILQQESIIMNYVDLFVSQLKKQTQGNVAKVDIKSWFNFTTFDITGDLMFGESFHCLDDSKLHPWIELVFQSIKVLVYLGAINSFPWVATALDRLVPKSVKQMALDHFNLGAQKVDQRLAMQTERSDFMTLMLKNGVSEAKGQVAPSEKEMILTRSELHSNAYILIVAGSETSATLLSGAIYYLCRNPATLSRLVREVRNAFAKDEDITFTKVSKLTYLNAVIEESLRIYPPFVTSLARISPGDTVAGDFVPSGVTVACHHYGAYHYSGNFAEPDSFVPERWLPEADPKFAQDRKDALQPFSLGPRGCLGQSLAYAEIRLILCKLLSNFDVSLCNESESWADQDVFFLWDKPALMVDLKERVI